MWWQLKSQTFLYIKFRDEAERATKQKQQNLNL